MKMYNEEIKDYLKKLVSQLLFVKSLSKQLQLMHEWENPQRSIALNIGSHFFRLVYYSFQRIIIIELCKIFSDKEQKSILDFLKTVRKHLIFLNPSRFNPILQNRENISTDDYLKIVVKHENLIADKTEVISKLKVHRDKMLVHSDENYFQNSKKLYHRYPLEFGEIVELINLAKVILESHHVYLLESHLEIEVHSSSNIDIVLQHVRAFNRVWHDKRVTSLFPYFYKLDNYDEKMKEHAKNN